MRWNGERPRDRGTAAVEFALVLPIALLVIFGIIDFGRMLNAQIVLTEATREAARAAALSGESAAEDRFAAIAGPVVGSTSPSIDACTPGDPDSDAEVDVTFDFQFVTPLAVIIGSKTLSAHGEMPCLH